MVFDHTYGLFACRRLAGPLAHLLKSVRFFSGRWSSDSPANTARDSEADRNGVG